MLDMVLWVPYRVLEILVYYDKDGRSILDRLPFFVRKIIKCFLRDARHDTRLNDDHEHVRLDALKQQAEIVMSRSLVLISIFALFEPPNGLFAEEWHCYFSWFGILTFGPLSLLGYLYARRKEMHHKP